MVNDIGHRLFSPYTNLAYYKSIGHCGIGKYLLQHTDDPRWSGVKTFYVDQGPMHPKYDIF